MTPHEKRPWTTSELAYLRQNYGNSTNAQLKTLFPNRTLYAIRSKALHMGLVKANRSYGEFTQGQRCGQLTLKHSIRKPDAYGVRHRHWTCVCKCGREIELTDQQLLTGLFQSCPDCVDQTDLPELRTKLRGLLKETCNKKNATGVRGVYFDKTSGKYSAYIQVQNRRIRLGQYESLEMAANVRNEFIESIRPMLNRLLAQRED